jgi:hypothetical protein
MINSTLEKDETDVFGRSCILYFAPFEQIQTPDPFG